MAGDLPPGTYSLCYTRSEGNSLSGNGQIVRISWEGGAQGIRLDNLPAGGQCWITHPNGTDLFLANVVDGVVTGQAPTIIPLPTFAVAPPSGLSHFIHAFGRIWGCQGKRLIYSDPFQYEWFRTPNFKPFLEDLVMVAPVTEGLYVNSKNSTWFLDGSDPAKMVVKRIGDGAIPGTLTFALIPADLAGGALTSPKFASMSQMPTPVWVGKHGYIVGLQGGNLVHLTDGRLRMSVRAQGGSLFRVKAGVPQIITVLRGQLLDEDPQTSVFENGKLF